MKTPQEWVDRLTLEPMTETQANQGVRVTRLEIAEIQSDSRAEVEQRIAELEAYAERGRATNRLNYETGNATLAKLVTAEQRVKELESVVANLRSELKLADDATQIREQKLAAAIERERVLRAILTKAIWCRGVSGLTLDFYKLLNVSQSELQDALAATGKEGEK